MFSTLLIAAYIKTTLSEAGDGDPLFSLRLCFPSRCHKNHFPPAPVPPWDINPRCCIRGGIAGSGLQGYVAMHRGIHHLAHPSYGKVECSSSPSAAQGLHYWRATCITNACMHSVLLSHLFYIRNTRKDTHLNWSGSVWHVYLWHRGCFFSE